MWHYNGKEFGDEDIPEGAFGMIYAMKAVIDGEEKIYIGKKQLISVRNVKKGKRELAAMKDKRGSKKKQVIKISDYKTYYSSNDILKEAREKGIEITRVVLQICYTKAELTYQETRWQFKLDVLENDKYLNDNILGKFYKKTLNL